MATFQERLDELVALAANAGRLAAEYDNLRTQGWLDGHMSGLDAAAAFLIERAVQWFREGKDHDASRLRYLALEMLEKLRPEMEERSKQHAQDHPILIQDDID